MEKINTSCQVRMTRTLKSSEVTVHSGIKEIHFDLQFLMFYNCAYYQVLYSLLIWHKIHYQWQHECEHGLDLKNYLGWGNGEKRFLFLTVERRKKNIKSFMLVLSANIFREMLPFQYNIVYMLCLSRACLISSLMKYRVTKWKFIICFYAFVQWQTRAGHCAQPGLGTVFFHAVFE